MRHEFRVFAHPDGDTFEEIERAVKAANGLQAHFDVQLTPETTVLSGQDRKRSYESLDAAFKRIRPEPKGLVLMEETPEEHRLVEEWLPKRIYCTCNVERGVDAPPMRLYLLYQIAAAALTLTSNIGEDVNNEMTHKPPVGCLWDWWSNDAERNLAMISARICGPCRDALRRHGDAGGEPIEATQQILEYIRRCMMGESPGIASRIFIAHGHGTELETLCAMLTEWNLPFEFFNRTPAAGVLTVDRWRQMLNGARFAFALMTPDDILANGDKQARQNVAHEIGLCHARLGIHNTAILRDTHATPFSNLDGVARIDFETGRLRDKAEVIRALLVNRGLL